MLNFDGKVEKKGHIINREPLYVNKKLYHESIENQYLVHRERVINVKSKVDDHVQVFSFLENQSWKKHRQQIESMELLKKNELIYSRINKVETSQSGLAKEQEDHLRKITVGTQHMNRLKKIARNRNVDKIQRENMYLKDRLKRVKPFYTQKLFQNSYEHHLTFIRGRRTDHTAGHLLDIPKHLQSQLPPGEQQNSSLDYIGRSIATAPTKSSSLVQSLRKKVRSASAPSPSKDQGSTVDSIISSSDSLSLLEIPHKLFLKLSAKPKVSPDKNKQKQKSDLESQDQEDDDFFDSTEDLDTFEENNDSPDAVSIASLFNGLSTDELKSKAFKHKQSTLDLDSRNDELTSTHVLLASCIAHVNDGTNVNLRVYTPRVYEETLLIRALTTVEPCRLIVERRITIDQAFDSINKEAEHKPSTIEDLQSLRGMLVSMFEEADTDHNGYLTFDEFQALMERIEVGISPQELRFVIAEADENENGYIDYQEFVPLAVDMIQAFRARTRARYNQELFESTLEEEILNMVSQEDIGKLSRMFFDRLKVVDVRKSGAMRPTEIRKILKSIAMKSLTNSEINMICQSLPRDPFGRLMYKDFQKVLYQVKVAAMRNMMLESQGNDIHRYIMQICRDEERRLLKMELDLMPPNPDAGFVSIENMLTGWLPLRNVIDIMNNSPRLSLSRLQVMVIVSEAEVVDGKVNYVHFAPIAAKTIEIMFEPKALKLRAELIESTDLSPEKLLNGDSTEAFTRRLKTLFKSYDLERKGELNSKQFRACMEAMELELTAGEIHTLMTIADIDNNGTISFDEFAEFCLNNLLHLEREKHIRILQKEINGTLAKSSKGDGGEESMHEHLRRIFDMTDVDKSGTLSYQELESLFQSLDIHITAFQLSVVLSEFDTNSNGSVTYEQFIPICVEIFEAIKAKNFAQEEKRKREQEIEAEVMAVAATWENEVKLIGIELFNQLRVATTIADLLTQKSQVIEIVRNPSNGLSRTESNLLLSMLLHSRSPADLSSNHNHNHLIAPKKAEHAYDAYTGLNLTSVGLFLEMVTFVRKTSIMREMLEKKEPSLIAKQLLARFTDEAEKIRKEKEEAEPVYYLSIKTIIKVLEHCTNLRLRNDQIISLLSWSDAFQSPDIGIDYRQFAFYAGDVIAKMHDKHELTKRMNVMQNPNFDVSHALKGITREDVEEHIKKYFTTMTQFSLSDGSEASKKTVESMLHAAIKSIPLLNLADREAAAVAAAILSNPNVTDQWQSWVPYAFNNIRVVCMDRMIGRRVKLMAAQSDVLADHEELQKIAEQVVEVVTVRKKGTSATILMKGEVNRNPRKSSLLTVSPKRTSSSVSDQPPSSPTIAKTRSCSVDDNPAFFPHETYTIARSAIYLPVIKSKRVKFACDIDGLYVLVRISENEPTVGFDKPSIKVTAMSPDATLMFTLHLNMRLPSLGLVDQDAAHQFAVNIINQLCFEYTDKMQLELNLRSNIN